MGFSVAQLLFQNSNSIPSNKMAELLGILFYFILIYNNTNERERKKRTRTFPSWTSILIYIIELQVSTKNELHRLLSNKNDEYRRCLPFKKCIKSDWANTLFHTCSKLMLFNCDKIICNTEHNSYVIATVLSTHFGTQYDTYIIPLIIDLFFFQFALF